MKTETIDERMLATSADIKPDFAKPINSVDKKALVELMQKEFDAQRVVFDQRVREKQAEVMERCRTAVGFERLTKAVDLATESLEELKERKKQELEAFKKKQDDEISIAVSKKDRALNNLYKHGFKPDGELLTNRGHWCDTPEHKEGKAKAEAIQQELDDIEKQIYPAENQKNKYTALLWGCSTLGEAMVIMREVLGNGVLPTIKKTDLPYNSRQLTAQ